MSRIMLLGALICSPPLLASQQPISVLYRPGAENPGEIIVYVANNNNAQPAEEIRLPIPVIPETQNLPAISMTRWMNDPILGPILHGAAWYGGWVLLNSILYYFRAPRLLAFNSIAGGAVLAFVLVKDAVRIFNPPQSEPAEAFEPGLLDDRDTLQD